MTQSIPVPTSNGSAAPTQNQHLLEQLIKEGLAPSTHDTNVDISRYRRLIEVLVQECLVNPIISLPTSTSLDHARLTLTILERQANARPDVLSQCPPPPAQQVPLYKQILPRIIATAIKYEGVDGGSALVEELCAAAVSVLRILGKDTSEAEEGSSYMKGSRRTVVMLNHLVEYTQDIIDEKTASLFGYAIPTTPLTVLIIHRIILLSRPQLSDHIHARVILQLGYLSHRLKSLSLQARCVETLAIAVDNIPTSSSLATAFGNVAGWCDTSDKRLRGALERLLANVTESKSTARIEMWWSLRDQADALHLPTHLKELAFLLTPVKPRLTTGIIRSLLGSEQTDRWREDAIAIGQRGEHIVRLLDGEQEELSKKRKRADGRAVALVQQLPNVEGDVENVVTTLAAYVKSADCDHTALASTLGDIACATLCCEGHRAPYCYDLEEGLLDIWIATVSSISLTPQNLGSLLRILQHISPNQLAAALQQSDRKPVLHKAWEGMIRPDRRSRLLSGRIISTVYTAQYQHPIIKISAQNQAKTRDQIKHTLRKGKFPLRETCVLLLGDLGRRADEENLGEVLYMLIQQLGSENAPLRSLAYTELLGLAKGRNKSPYILFSPFMERISVLLAESVVRSPEIVSETMAFIGSNRKAFFTTNSPFILPALVLAMNRQALDVVASIVGESLGILLLDHIASVLNAIYLKPRLTDKCFEFLTLLLRNFTSGEAQKNVYPAKLMQSCIIPLVVSLVVELGDEDPTISGNADQALRKAYEVQTGFIVANDVDLGPFLKPHMLGVISNLNDTLHDVQGKKTVVFKRKVIRSLTQLIRLVGGAMSSFSPQIMASLQSTLGIPELREETLRTWTEFVKTLRFSDVGPFIGRTSGALVAQWPTFTTTERELALSIINYIADNASSFSTWLDDIVGLEAIPELSQAGVKLSQNRKKWPFEQQLTKLLERTQSKNIAVATMSMKELKRLLNLHAERISQMCRGDAFDSLISLVIQSLLVNAARDGDCQDLRDLSHECIGLVGALDPDRFVPIPEAVSMTLMSNFADPDETIDFAIHIVSGLLVDAFRATNDTKHQNYLAYAIQELLKFCGFSTRVLQGGSAPVRVRQKWNEIPAYQHETLTPLLEGRFLLGETPMKTYAHPIYATAPTYREWIQWWTNDLIGKVMTNPKQDPATINSQTVFGVCRGVLRNQDVTVANHLLPHIVLNVLLIGNDSYRDEICAEINTVLQDQVNPSGSLDKRSLSAQVIFDLMDHLSKWLRLQRQKSEKEKAKEKAIVEKVLSSIETELMANAALQSKAYARSLRSFEQRIVQLRKERRRTADLQTYYERLHQIYAELDEPDGMEGVSTSVISPSLEHQIREHESTGRWTSAQSCWEVRLQQSPEDVKLHVGLMKCLRNIGHYDTLRTHIRGVLSRQPQWQDELAPFEAEAAWICGDWESVARVGATGPPIGQALLALQRKQFLEPILVETRRLIGNDITSKQYSRSHEPILQLHLLREIELIDQANRKMIFNTDLTNRAVINQNTANHLVRALQDRLSTTSPSFRVSEAILSIRRTAFGSITSPKLKSEVGLAWIQTSKLARKAGYEQTAYSAVLQAKEVDAPFAFVQQAKLLRVGGGVFKALTDLQNSISMVKKENVVDMTDTGFTRDRNLAKAVLLEARWSNETDRFDANNIIAKFTEANNLASNLESPYYHLGHYYDSKAASASPDEAAPFNAQTCINYIYALERGVKYIYQTMPRLLTIWLDLAETDRTKKNEAVHTQLLKISAHVDRARKNLSPYQFLTAFPQIVSRIVHSNKEVGIILMKIMSSVIVNYPHQALWPTVGVMQSNRPERKTACTTVLKRVQNSPELVVMVKEAERLSSVLLRLAEDKAETKKREPLSLAAHFPYVKNAFPSQMIIPLQDALTCTLPSSPETLKHHNPFPAVLVKIHGIQDRIDVMPSLQKPKKLVFLGSDGKMYPFLCKPHDDLRKDARLMDFNSMINKLLKSASESRRRHLYIRTYAVMPLNEECGLLEWVSNTNAFKSILDKGYHRQGKRLYSTELATVIDETRKKGPAIQAQAFRDKILPMYSPPVFHEWFLTTWPEPSAWLTSRLNYGRTLAVMSMIGHVLGLGDRHGENILFDGVTGDTVHVDLNCLFEKGKSFEIPERVPFRLTHNMVDALGVTGVEGVFRKAAEISMAILRENSESLMSVLEAFAHDPLVEWQTKSGRSKSDKDVRTSAEKNLRPIRAKLAGSMGETIGSVPNQVEALIKEATSISHLAVMYQGWAAWL